MYTLSVANEKGDQLQLTQNINYTIINVDGLNPPTANINTAINANFDGATFKSSRLNTRNIVIKLAIEGNVETNRIALYNYFKSKKPCTIYYQNNTRNISIKGYVESFEIGFFDQKQIAQISILCPNPYFINTMSDDTELSFIQSLFEFPFAIEEEGIEFSTISSEIETIIVNEGDVETGMMIEFHATGSATNPTLYNVDTGEKIKININMNEGDTIIVNTNKGSKSIVQIVNGAPVNIINNLDLASTWLQLNTGSNTMLFTADSFSNNLICNIIYNDLFKGV